MSNNRSVVRSLTAAELEPLSKARADTVDGLTGSEIGQFLAQKIAGPDPTMAKWNRLPDRKPHHNFARAGRNL